MKRNILFSFALCLGLLLPTANFGSEPSQTWSDKIVNYFTKYMPQWQKYALYAALIAALGYGFYKIPEIEIPEPTDFQKWQHLQRKTIAIYDLTMPTFDDLYSPSNLKNIATFLTEVAAAVKNDWEYPPFNPQDQQEQAIAKLFGIDESIFNTFVLPILEQLSIPERPQALINYEAGKGMQAEPENLQDDDTLFIHPVEIYYGDVHTFWKDFIDRIKKQDPTLKLRNKKYLEFIRYYLKKTGQDQFLQKSITDALELERGI